MNLLILLSILSTVQAIVHLDKKNFEELTLGKKAIVAFKAPQCDHCKKLKRELERLEERSDILIGEVDCTKNEGLCNVNNIYVQPTIKYSNGYRWYTYEKGYNYHALQGFVKENMGDTCFDDKSLCTQDELEKINLGMKLTNEDVRKHIEDLDKKIIDIKISYLKQTDELENQYEEMAIEKDKKIKKIEIERGYLKYVSKKKFL